VGASTTLRGRTSDGEHLDLCVAEALTEGFEELDAEPLKSQWQNAERAGVGHGGLMCALSTLSIKVYVVNIA
jgi:hypothetical protein